MCVVHVCGLVTYTLHPTPYAPNPTPYTHTTPYTLNLKPYTLNLNPAADTRRHPHNTLHPKTYTSHPTH